MADITMCQGGDCPKKNKCYRYRAIPGIMQSYFNTASYKNDQCSQFWQIEKGVLLNNKKVDKKQGNNSLKMDEMQGKDEKV